MFKLNIAVIGLGYVGLPLALEFAKKRCVIAYDVDKKRINDLGIGKDKNLEFSKKEILSSQNLTFTNSEKDLTSSNCYIVTVPTPIDKYKKPNLNPLRKASELIGKIIKKNDLVIYESTVYPGCTEEFCIPLIEKSSGLKINEHFFCGYSPERINPGDKKYTISKIKKITSGSSPKVASIVNKLYKEIITEGTYKAPSIKVAEAAKIIENTQRDLNIALMNELSILFSKLNIDTTEVLNAALTKWNFLPFRPGLVGGHCIGVDPFYLTYKAKRVGYDPKIILGGRKLNDSMGGYVVSKFIDKLKEKKINITRSKILVMGLTFKEDCNDIRNSGVTPIIKGLEKYRCKLDLFDPWVSEENFKTKHRLLANIKFNINTYDGVIVAVAHKKFKRIGLNAIKKICKKKHVFFDLKNIFLSKKVDFKF